VTAHDQLVARALGEAEVTRNYATATQISGAPQAASVIVGQICEAATASPGRRLELWHMVRAGVRLLERLGARHRFAWPETGSRNVDEMTNAADRVARIANEAIEEVA
jgi:hypothetical protein